MLCEAWSSDLSPEFCWLFLCTQEKSLWFLEWTIWLQLLWWLTDNMVPKECQGQALSVLGHPHVAGHIGPFLPRTLLCGCISFSSSLLTGPFLFFCLLPSVPSLLLDGTRSYTHKCCLLVSFEILCTFHAPEPVCLLAAFLYFLLSLLPPHGKCWLCICLHQRKCMWKPPCPSCMVALLCSHIFTAIPWGRFAIST